jgi:hypothetical protein
MFVSKFADGFHFGERLSGWHGPFASPAEAESAMETYVESAHIGYQATLRYAGLPAYRPSAESVEFYGLAWAYGQRLPKPVVHSKAGFGAWNITLTRPGGAWPITIRDSGYFSGWSPAMVGDCYSAQFVGAPGDNAEVAYPRTTEYSAS